MNNTLHKTIVTCKIHSDKQIYQQLVPYNQEANSNRVNPTSIVNTRPNININPNTNEGYIGMNPNLV